MAAEAGCGVVNDVPPRIWSPPFLRDNLTPQVARVQAQGFSRIRQAVRRAARDGFSSGSIRLASTPGPEGAAHHVFKLSHVEGLGQQRRGGERRRAAGVSLTGHQDERNMPPRQVVRHLLDACLAQLNVEQRAVDVVGAYCVQRLAEFANRPDDGASEVEQDPRMNCEMSSSSSATSTRRLQRGLAGLRLISALPRGVPSLECRLKDLGVELAVNTRFSGSRQIEVFPDLGELALLDLTNQNDRDLNLGAWSWPICRGRPLVCHYRLMHILPTEPRPLGIGKDVEGQEAVTCRVIPSGHRSCRQLLYLIEPGERLAGSHDHPLAVRSPEPEDAFDVLVESWPL